MEHFAQTNVFARIRTVFSWIQTVFAHLIIGCAIRYPKIGCLRYGKNRKVNTIWLVIFEGLKFCDLGS